MSIQPYFAAKFTINCKDANFGSPSEFPADTTIEIQGDWALLTTGNGSIQMTMPLGTQVKIGDKLVTLGQD